MRFKVRWVPMLVWLLLVACSTDAPSLHAGQMQETGSDIPSPSTTRHSASGTISSATVTTVPVSTVTTWCREGESGPCWVVDEGKNGKATWSAEADPFTDQITSRVRTKSESDNHYLFMGCTESSPGWVALRLNDTYFYSLGLDGQPDLASVKWRVDRGEVHEGQWALIEQDDFVVDSVLVPGTDPNLRDWTDARTFVDQIWGAETVAMRVTMPNDDSFTAVFDLQGFFSTPLSGDGGNLERCEVPSLPASQYPPIEGIGSMPGTVAAGGTHSCMLRPDGTVLCWGGNQGVDAGPPDGTFTTLTAGYSHTCGLRQDGQAECWGASGPIETPEGFFVVLDAGDAHTCGLRRDGTIQCWGSNRNGETDAPTGQFLSVASSCGLRRDGTIQCWGTGWLGSAEPPDGSFVALTASGTHACALRGNGTVACWGDNDDGQTLAPRGQFVALSAGGTYSDEGYFGHSCGIRLDRTVDCWGAIQSPPTGERFKAIASGGSHACGVTTQGEVNCWGWNSHGQTLAPDARFKAMSAGAGTCGIQTEDAVVCWKASSPSGGIFLEVAAGGEPFEAHVCGLEPEGHVRCWGNNWDGQTDSPSGRFQAVSTGFDHSCGLGIDGKVQCWGSDIFGQSTPPAGIFTSISAGGWHTCGLTTRQTVSCWGHNRTNAEAPRLDIVSSTMPDDWCSRNEITHGHHGECWGDNQFGQSTPPPGTFTTVSSGGWHTCGLSIDGTIECWGDDTSGQSTPPPGTYSMVSAGGWHTCGLSIDGTIECWGDDTSGQSTPPPGTFTSVAAGYGHSCGLRSDGSISCWGYEAHITTPR